MKGIDVSKWQGNIDWKKVSGKIDFAILRAGYGKVATQKDTTFEQNYKGCIDNKIPCGAYWYSYANTTDEAVEEAEAFIKVLNGRKLEYPVYYDVEEKDAFILGKTKVSAIINAFLKRMEKAGYWAGLYMSASPLKDFVDEKTRKQYAIWVAHHGVSKPSYNGEYGIWQYSSEGKIDGIDGNVDLNEGIINYPPMIKAVGLNNTNTKVNKPTKGNNNITVTLTIGGKLYSGTLYE